MKQTAVDYLVEQLIEYDFSPRENTYLIEIPSWIFKEKLEKAREMMMEQVKDAYGDGINGHRNDFCNRDEYFVKTYGDVS
jgi:hypothetical protein